MYDLPDLPDLPPLPDLPIINNETKPVKYNMRLYAILSKLSYDKNPIHLFGKYNLSNQFKVLTNFSNTDMLTVKDTSNNIMSGNTSATANNLTPGWHRVQITDANSCIINDSIFVTFYWILIDYVRLSRILWDPLGFNTIL